MLKHFIAIAVFVIVFFGSCSVQDKTDKYQTDRSEVVNVQDQVHEFQTGEVLVGNVARVYCMGRYLIVVDHKSVAEQIHIFNTDDFSHLASIAPLGKGPGEITRIGSVCGDLANRYIYVSDHGKQKIFAYDIEQALSDTLYQPAVWREMSEREFPSKYAMLDDSTALTVVIRPTGNVGFNQAIAFWHLQSGIFEDQPYDQPEVKRKRVSVSVSSADSLYVEAYSYHDLLTLHDLSGNLKYNIYGPEWDKNESKTGYFGDVIVAEGMIVCSYLGGDRFIDQGSRGKVSNLPVRLLIFDKNGDYIRTAEIGYRISDICYDPFHKRLIMAFDDEIQFGYLDLNDLL